MGLADRFKNELKTNEIFTVESEKKEPPFVEELKVETLNKIQNTPYWNEYSIKAQERMISKYFDTKLHRGNVIMNQNEKMNFVKNILDNIRDNGTQII
ncbi:hypothetical protein J6G99_07190 [bacterium]|nr:hypothetical protein [bacterium]